jgi:hypothetical protein
MRPNVLIWLCSLVLLNIGGCTKRPFEGPTVEAFDGRIVQEGKQVSPSKGERVVIRLMQHGTGEQFGIPISPQGTFNIGEMPVGTFSVVLERTPPMTNGGAAQPRQEIAIDDPFKIEEGQTQYDIELGKAWRGSTK